MWESAWLDLERGISDLALDVGRLGDFPAASGDTVPEEVGRLIREHGPAIGGVEDHLST